MSRSRTIRRYVVLGVFIVFVILVAFGVSAALRTVKKSETSSSDAAATVTVRIKQGMSATQVGQALEQSGVIDSSTAFVSLVRSRGTENSLRPGTYKFQKGTKLETIVAQLETGEGAVGIKVTLAEGLAIDQVGALLTKGGKVDGGAYVSLSKQPSKFILPTVGGTTVTVTTMEGLLFPSTYLLEEGVTDQATALIKAQLTAFGSKTSSLPWSNATQLGISPYQVLIIASMIEKEAKIADERPKVAAVIYNRLKKGMTLGIDATIRYALNKWTGPLTNSDLAINSPYNTRIKNGIPPTPICNPGMAAIRAALEPANVNYLYYVLSDTQGHHFFTASYQEFLNAKKNEPAQ